MQKKIRTSHWLVTATVLLGQFLTATLVTCDEIPTIALPTPRSHYERFKPGISGNALLQELAKDLDPEDQKKLFAFVAVSGLLKSGSTAALDSPEASALLNMAEATGINIGAVPPKPQAIALLKQLNWVSWRPVLLEFVLHQSQVFEMIPPKYQTFWYPIVHDAFLYFLNALPQDRLLEKLVDIAYLPPGSTRGADIIAFVSKTPSLQKVGQILARNPALPSDYRQALQEFENGIHTMSRDELVQFIQDDIGPANIDKYKVEFADTMLAEASVGAVIRATCIPPGSPEKREAICKVIKPYVLINLPQELEIFDGLAAYFTREHDFYQLGTIPLVHMFKEVRKALTNEIKILEEQQNLVRARKYYQKNKNIVVPELFSISTNHVTFMEFITGEKITSAFEGQPAQRAIMAKRLYDVMTRDVIFAKSKEPIFHGDPHAGNVFHVTGNSKNPYQIALLDWGLYGSFPRQDRIAMVQLILGVQFKDAKRLHNNVSALIEGGLPESPEKRQRIDAIITEILQPKEGRTSFDALALLLANLVNEGYATKYSLNLFIKSQVTIAGILQELDPTLDQDKYLMQRVTSLVKREIPKRILFTLWFPAWDSRKYRSLLSNQDLVDIRKLSKKPKKSKKTTAQSTQNASKLEPVPTS